MSLRFISGKPGGGKSYLALRWIVEELLHGKRTVITNLPLKLPELSEYLQKKYPEKEIDLHARVRMLEDEEVYEFFRYRGRKPGENDEPYGPYYKLPESDTEGRIKPEEVATAKSLGGCYYVIDEIHLYFNSREWQKTGKAVLWYISQHRKLSDEIVAITQMLSNVDKQFRGMSQDFTYVRNHGKEKYLSIFAGFKKCTTSVYQQPYTGNQQASERGMFTVDVSGLANCYDTSAGAGISGGTVADSNQKTRGIPFWGVFVLLSLVLVAIFFVPEMLGKALLGGVTKISTASTVGSSLTNAVTHGGAAIGAAPPIIPPPSSSFHPPSMEKENEPEPEKVTMCGMYQMGRGEVTVMLSDGRKVTFKDGLQFYCDRYCIVEGQRYEVNKKYVGPQFEEQKRFNPFNRTFQPRNN
jgi:hypothetical protein